MFIYQKKLQYPVKIATPNPKLASYIISQYGGPDGEVGAAMRYLSQRYAMPYDEAKGVLTDIGTEELGHMEMVATVVHQLTRNLTDEEVRSNPSFAPYFVDHTTGIYPTAAAGTPWSADGMQSTGDVIADLTEDLAAEQKARVTYDNILRLSDDPDVNNVIRFLREREIVHFQRFGEGNLTKLSKSDPLPAGSPPKSRPVSRPGPVHRIKFPYCPCKKPVLRYNKSIKDPKRRCRICLVYPESAGVHSALIGDGLLLPVKEGRSPYPVPSPRLRISR